MPNEPQDSCPDFDCDGAAIIYSGGPCAAEQARRFLQGAVVGPGRCAARGTPDGTTNVFVESGGAVREGHRVHTSDNESGTMMSGSPEIKVNGHSMCAYGDLAKCDSGGNACCSEQVEAPSVEVGGVSFQKAVKRALPEGYPKKLVSAFFRGYKLGAAAKESYQRRSLEPLLKFAHGWAVDHLRGVAEKVSLAALGNLAKTVAVRTVTRILACGLDTVFDPTETGEVGGPPTKRDREYQRIKDILKKAEKWRPPPEIRNPRPAVIRNPVSAE